jgi:glycosyltransferase involved in cell wall biosynthesis
MRIWLITIGEPLPIDRNGADRLYRTGILSDLLAKRGHEVIWWSSTFDHIRKQHRFLEDVEISLNNGVLLKLLHGCGYKRNVSFKRILDHVILGLKFRHRAKFLNKPDLIMCSFPSLELPVFATRYGKYHSVPVILDIRDLWPDIFLEIVPDFLRPLFYLLLAPMRYQASYACKGAFAITGNSPNFVKWGLQSGNRLASELDQDFPFGYKTPNLIGMERERALQFWAKYDLIDYSGFTVCFFGTFGKQFDLEAVIDAGLMLEASGVKVRFVLCGTGENLEVLKIRAKQSQAIIFPGWVGHSEIIALMEISDVGLAPYKNHKGFLCNLPNKPIEYLAGGLPVLSGLNGYLEKLLEINGCGLNYDLENPKSLCDLIKNLIENKELVTSMSINAKKLYAEKFSADLVYDEMMDYMQNIVVQYSSKL